MSDAVIGQVLVGKYRVERILGQGGMGMVVEATHLHLLQRVAIKFILPEALHNPEVRGRFLREAMAAAKLRSAHVARVLDIGTLETGSPFIVMELLEGEDLATILRRQGPLPIATAAAWLLEACEALAEAHALGIIHRDLKPGNLFLASGAGGLRSIKVFDFGISKVTNPNELDHSMTRTTMVMGSPGYASPEQLRSTKNVDLRTDIWALGVTLYQLVSGDMPWKADTLPELSIKIAVDPAPTFHPNLRVPQAFAGIIRRCLEKDPTKRFPNIAALAEALGEFAPSGAAAVDRVRRAGMGTGPLPSSTTANSAGEISTPIPGQRKSSTKIYAIAAGALVAAIGIVAAVASQSSGGTTTNQPVVKASPPDAGVAEKPVVVQKAVVPDAPVATQVVVAATPDAAVAAIIEPPPPRPDVPRVDTPHTDGRPTQDLYRDFLAEGRRLSRGNCAQAVKLYEKAIDQNPKGGEALSGLGSCLNQLGDYDRAISNFLGALDLSRKNPEALYGIADAYQHKNNVPAAVANYKAYLEVAPHGDRAGVARRMLDRLTGNGGKQSDDDLFGAGSGK